MGVLLLCRVRLVLRVVGVRILIISVVRLRGRIVHLGGGGGVERFFCLGGLRRGLSGVGALLFCVLVVALLAAALVSTVEFPGGGVEARVVEEDSFGGVSSLNVSPGGVGGESSGEGGSGNSVVSAFSEVSCPDGFVLSGDGVWCERVEWMDAFLGCPVGAERFSVGGLGSSAWGCRVDLGEAQRVFSCAEGVLTPGGGGEVCEVEVEVTEVESAVSLCSPRGVPVSCRYVDASGSVRFGELSFSCPQGWILSNSSCSRTLMSVERVPPLVEEVCGEGVLFGGRCYRFVEAALSCGEGWELISGECRRVTVAAASPVGDRLTSGDPTTTTTAAVVVVRPGRPGSFRAVAGAGSLSLSWVRPTSDGGSPLVGYRVDWRAGLRGRWSSVLLSGADTTSHVISGLNGGVKYYVRLKARNSSRESYYLVTSGVPLTACPSGEVYSGSAGRCVGAPAAPGGAWAVSGAGSLSVRWYQLSPSSGGPVEGYSLRWRRRGSTDTWSTASAGASGGSSYTLGSLTVKSYSHTISSLVNGTVYEVGVASRNAAGLSAYASAAGAPCATGQYYNGTSCVVTPTTTTTTTAATTTTTTTTAATTTTTTAPATTTTTLPSCVSPLVLSRSLGRCVGVPSVPRSVVAVGGGGALTVYWRFPSSTGGAPVQAYELRWRVSPSGSWETLRLPVGGIRLVALPVLRSYAFAYTFTNLTNGTLYEFGVSARNEAGKSPETTVTARPCPVGQRDTGSACAAPTATTTTTTTTAATTTTTTTTTTAAGGATTTTTLVPYCVPGEVFSRAWRGCVGKPSLPRWVRAVSRDGALSVLWEDPVSDGGSPLVAYSVQWRREGVSEWNVKRVRVGDAVSFGLPGSSRVYRVHTIAGLVNGVFYRVGVSAENEAGSSPPRMAAGVPCPPGKPATPAGCRTPAPTTTTTTTTTTTAATTTTTAATTTTTTTATAATTTTTAACSVVGFVRSSVLGGCVGVPAPPTVYGVVSGVGSLKITWGYASEVWPNVNNNEGYGSDAGFGQAESFSLRWRVRGSSGAWTPVVVKRSAGVLDLNPDGKPAEVWEYDIGGLADGTVYEVGVAAVNAAGTGVYASAAGAACPAGQRYSAVRNGCVVRSAPGAPENLRAWRGDGFLFLTWDPPSVGASEVTGYVLRWRESGSGDWYYSTELLRSPRGDDWDADYYVDAASGRSNDPVSAFKWLPDLKNGVLYEVGVAARGRGGDSAYRSGSASPTARHTSNRDEGRRWYLSPGRGYYCYPGPGHISNFTSDRVLKNRLCRVPPVLTATSTTTTTTTPATTTTTTTTPTTTTTTTAATAPTTTATTTTTTTAATTTTTLAAAVPRLQHGAFVGGRWISWVTPARCGEARKVGEVYDAVLGRCVDAPDVLLDVRVLAEDGGLTVAWKLLYWWDSYIWDSSREVADFVVRWRELGSSGDWLTEVVPWEGSEQTYIIIDEPVVVDRTWVSAPGGLTNGVAYEVQVAARNAAGAGKFTAASAVPCPAGQAYSPTAAGCAPASAGTLDGLTLTSSGGLGFSWSYRLPAALGGGGSPVSGFLGQYRESGTTQEWADMPWDNYDYASEFWDITPLDEVNIMTWTQERLRLPSWKPEVLYDVRVAPQYKDGTRGGFVEATAASCPRGKSYSPSSLRKCVSPPSAPGGFTASAGDSTISLAWGKPPSDGGDPPSGFELRWRKLGSTGGWETRTIPWDSATTVMNFGPVLRSWHQTLSGLDNAVRYEVGVSAVNRAGYSPWVQAVLAPCPRGRTYVITRAACNILTDPGKPRNFTLTSGNQTITASWEAPSTTGGSPIVSYIVRWNKVGSDGTPKEQVVNAPASQLTITGLSNTEHYWVEVAARNRARQGDYTLLTSAPCAGPYNSATQKCATKPSRRWGLHAASADGGLQFIWRAPSDDDDGGSPITSYKITLRWNEGGTRHETSTTISESKARLDTSPGVSQEIWSVRLPYPSTLPALKNGLLYSVGVAATNAVGTGSTLFTVGMPCPAGETYNKQYSSCVPRSCPSGKVHSPLNGECVPKCGRGEEYNETKGGCRPTNNFCENNPNLSLARNLFSGYCEYAWTETPDRNDINYIPVYCDDPSEFSAQANADTYINTNLPLDGTSTIAQKPNTIAVNPMCPPTGLFLALGESRRHYHNPTDLYHPEWAFADDLEVKHSFVIVRGSGDCTVISDVVRLYNEGVKEHGKESGKILTHVSGKLRNLFPEGSNEDEIAEEIADFGKYIRDTLVEHLKVLIGETSAKWTANFLLARVALAGLAGLEVFLSLVAAEWKDGVFRLRSGMLTACQAHDYCYDLIRSGLHQTVLEEGRGGDKKDGVSGCDEVLKQLWTSYCWTLDSPPDLICQVAVVYGFTAAVRRFASTPPAAGIVVLRNSKTGKCLTSKSEPAKVVQEHCRFNDNHKPNDEDQWFHVLQAEPFTNAASGPTEAGYFYVVPANVNPSAKETWQKSETDAAGGKCLYVSSVTSTKVREGSCMVGGVRLSSRVFKLVNTSVADEYGIRSVWNTCWQPKAGDDDAETAADGVSIVSVLNSSGCDAVLQRWRIEPVDPTAASR